MTKTHNSVDFAGLSNPEAPIIRMTPPGPESSELLAYQQAHESSAVSYAKGMPMAIKRARGATVEDVDGNVYIDCFAGAGVMAVGHANPAVLEAAHEQIDQVTHSLDIPTPTRISLDEALLEVLPEELARLFYGGPTGSDAVEQAMKLAKYNTGRSTFIGFEGGYHGMTSGALALTTTRSHKEGLLPLVPGINFTPYAYCYRCHFGKEPDSCSMECTQYLEHLLENPHSGVMTPAAVVVEPIQGEGGSIVPPERFLPNVREICSRYGILLICDEIQSGLGRTGKMFAFEHTQTVPDVVTMSKALGGLGFPISAIAYRDELDTWPTGISIGTFRGNMVAFAAGARALEFMMESGLLDHAEALGDSVLNSLTDLERGSEIIGEARGKGLMLGVEFVSDKETKQPAPELATRARTLCHQRGVMIEVGGHYGNVARFLPPLVITRELMDRAIEIFSGAVRELEQSLS